jgi:protein-disulfide isomerase
MTGSDEATLVTSRTKKRAQRHARMASPPRRTQAAHSRSVVAPRRRKEQSRLSKLVRSPRRLYRAALAFAVLAGSALIGLSLVSAHRSTSAAPSGSRAVVVIGTAETAALLDGIPQRGNRLGSSRAPVQLVEYADPQCPYCAGYTRDVLPILIEEYVRPGRVQLVFRGLWFLGPGSDTALRTAAAAASENRFWNLIDLLYRNQGPENAWVTDDLMRAITNAAGADATRVAAGRNGAAVTTMIDRWGRLAQADGVNGVPAFFVRARGGAFQRLPLTAIAPLEFRQALDNALAQ